MKQADSNYIQRMLELCKFIKWKNVESFDELKQGNKKEENKNEN